jgi:hypothetical protein
MRAVGVPGSLPAVSVRRIPGLFDIAVVIASDGGLGTPDRPDRSLTGSEWAEVVRRGGGDGLDVRLLCAAGERNLPTLVAMARELGRDVLVAPAGSELRLVAPIEDPPAGRFDEGDVVAVDLATGSPVDWITVAPSGPATSPLGWFALTGGRVFARSGPVVLPLPGGGLSLATREDFVRSRAAAAALRPGHPDLLTVAVGVRSGYFVVGDYGGRSILCDGRAFAAALAILPLYGSDLRVWLSWPESTDDWRGLRHNLTELAEVTGATIWAPAAGGRAEILDGCRDLAAVGRDDQPTRWEPYGEGGTSTFMSDVDGRLVPASGVAVTTYPGVPLVSVPSVREQEMNGWHESPPADGLFRADLAILADGRVALRYHDDCLLAAGGRQLAQLLRRLGWHGDDIVLLSTVAPELAVGARRHLDSLADDLGCAITIGEPPPAPPTTAPPAPAEPAARPSAVRPGAADVRHTVGAAGTVAPEPEPEPEPAPPPPPARPDREATRYPTAAVGRALAELDPGDPHEAALLLKLTAAVADHSAGGRRLARTQGVERAFVARELVATTQLIASLTGPWRDDQS